MKTFSDSFSKSYADWSAVGLAMILGHAPASPGRNPNAKPALRKAPAKKRPAKKANRAKRR